MYRPDTQYEEARCHICDTHLIRRKGVVNPICFDCKKVQNQERAKKAYWKKKKVIQMLSSVEVKK